MSRDVAFPALWFQVDDESRMRLPWDLLFEGKIWLLGRLGIIRWKWIWWGLDERASYGFSSGHVWMWELDYKESWAPKNWCFWTVVLEKTLESPLDCKEIQPVHPKGISPEYSLEGLMLKLKLQYFGHLLQRSDSFEKTLMLGKIEGRRSGWQRMKWLDGITDSMDISLSKFRELVIDREPWHATVHGVTKNRTRLSDWTAVKKASGKCVKYTTTYV